MTAVRPAYAVKSPMSWIFEQYANNRCGVQRAVSAWCACYRREMRTPL